MKYAIAFLILAIIYWRFKSLQKINNFPFIKERHPDECGPTCLAMIAKYFGRETTIDVLCKWMDVIRREGTSMRDVVIAGEKLDLKVLPVKIPFDRNDGLSLYDAPLPCILHWHEHYFVVLYKIHGNKFYVAHPGRGKMILEKENFKQSWTTIQSRKKEGTAVLFELKK